MNFSVETPNEEELEEYFTPPQSPNSSDDHGLKSMGKISIHIRR
jgi:hypothetical protein